ncbi:hypothetical protein ELI07_07340 [Rhizobium leguminosarum]|nr:hypothetical protein ELI07_07340 [Rhizobium leguminosarum]TAY15118.1 hypothetical protein ELH96_08865 [Rhizobium leguminosarum]
MAKLPELQSRGAVTRGPQSSLSGAEIANPFQQIANAFDSWGETLQAKAADDARIQGENAVYRDADGNPRVELRSNLGQMNRIYNRSASQAQMAQTEIDTKGAMTRLQQEARGDPETFKAAAKGYRDQALINAPKELRGPIGTMIDGEIQSNFDGVTRQKFQADMQSNKSVLLQSAAMKSDDMAALARAGGVNTPEYQKAREEVRTLWSELSGNPVFGISPKEADLRMQQGERKDMAEAILGRADRAIDAGGVEEARRLADSVLTDTSINLSPSERRKYSGLIMENVRGYRAEQKAAVAPLKELSKERIKQWEAGGGLDDADDDELIANIRKGDPAFASFLLSRRRTLQQVRDIKNMTDDQQAAILAHTSRAGGGYLADKIVGVESGGDPDAQNPNSSAGGAGQFIDSTWLSMVKQYRPDVAEGKSAQEIIALKADGSLSREMTGRYAQENTAFLRNQGIQTTDGNVYLAHFLGPRGAAQVIKAAPSASVASIVGDGVVSANPFLRGMSAADVRAWADKKMGGAGVSSEIAGPTLTSEAAKTLSTEVASDLRGDIDDWRVQLSRGNVPDADSLDLLKRNLALVDDQDLRDEYAKLFSQNEAFQNAYRGDPAAAESFISGLQARASGEGASLAQMQILDAARAGAQAAAKAKADDPLGYGMSAYQRFPEIPALDFDDPGSWSGAFETMQRGVDTLRARGDVGDISALRPEMQTQVADVLANSNPVTAVRLLGAMYQNLDSETYRTTLGRLYASGQARAAAAAGALVPENPVVALGVLRGQQLLKENPLLAPKKTDDNSASIDDLLPPTAFAPALEGARQTLLDAATARYADLSNQVGDTSGELNDDRMQQSINEVTGGLVDFNGQMIVAPVYGMSQDAFDTVIANLTDRDLQGAITASGVPVRASDLRNEGRLRAVADGRYVLEFGLSNSPVYAQRAPSPGNYRGQSVFVLSLGK